MDIELNEEQTTALIQMLLSEVSTQKSIIEMQESFNRHAGKSVLEKDEEIQKLRAELKALKAANAAALGKRGPGRPKKVVKRGPGRPKKAVQ